MIPAQCQAEEFKYVDPVISGICPDDSKTGVLLLDDVYNGLEGSVKRGEVHSLQIMELGPKTRQHTGGYAYNISDAWLGNRTATVTSKVWSDILIMDQSLQIENSTPVFGPDYRINLTHPEWSQMLTAPLAKEASGLGLCKGKDGAAAFKDVSDADYHAMLQALQKGRRMLELNPRVDMLPRPDPAKPEGYAPGLQRPRVMP